MYLIGNKQNKKRSVPFSLFKEIILLTLGFAAIRSKTEIMDVIVIEDDTLCNDWDIAATPIIHGQGIPMHTRLIDLSLFLVCQIDQVA